MTLGKNTGGKRKDGGDKKKEKISRVKRQEKMKETGGEKKEVGEKSQR